MKVRGKMEMDEKRDDRTIGKRRCRSLAGCSLVLESNDGGVNSEKGQERDTE